MHRARSSCKHPEPAKDAPKAFFGIKAQPRLPAAHPSRPSKRLALRLQPSDPRNPGPAKSLISFQYLTPVFSTTFALFSIQRRGEYFGFPQKPSFDFHNDARVQGGFNRLRQA